MKCLLVLPPNNTGASTGGGPSKATNIASGLCPPLGLIHVAAYAEQLKSIDITVIDCRVDWRGIPQFEEKLKALTPDVVGISVMTFTLYESCEVAKAVKRVLPTTKIVMGGPHVAIYPGETICLPYVDYVIYGEGEFAVHDLLQALLAGDSPEGIPGVITKETDISRITIQAVENLNSLLPPARHLIDTSHYRSILNQADRTTTMMSSRGCPGQCIFCDRPQWGNKFRKRSATSVFNEVKDCYDKFDIKEFVFYDDTFTIDKQRVLDLCQLLADAKLPITWSVCARIDSVNEQMIKALARAGCNRIKFGVETGSARLQKHIRKNLDLSRIHEVITMTAKSGIEIFGYFMIGLPSETHEEIEMTINLMCSLPFDYVQVAIFTPYPGTFAYKQLLEERKYGNDYWREFATNPHPDFIPPVLEDNFTRAELECIRRRANRRFYFRPSYILKRLSKIRNIRELCDKGWMAVQLLRESFFDA